MRELTDKSYLLSSAELKDNYILGCQSIPKSDIRVRLPGANSNRTTVKGIISKQLQLTHNIAEIRVTLDQPVKYLNGQYAVIRAIGHGIPERCYSYANSCVSGGNQQVSFLVRAVPNGRMSNWLLSQEALGAEVAVTGSLGDFYLREGSEDLLCIVAGSGLAPVHALLQGAQTTEHAKRNVHLLMGVRSQQDLYYRDEIAELAQRWQGEFSYQAVLSDEPVDSNWQGVKGWVSNAITPTQVANSQAYLCGPPAMIDGCVETMTELGMGQEKIFMDKFLDQSINGAANAA